MIKENNGLESLKLMFEEMSAQYSKETKRDIKEAYLKVGTMFLYFWALANNNEQIKQSLVAETKVYFSNPDQFFEEAETDFDLWKKSNLDYVKYFENLNDGEYDKLVDYIQSKFKNE